ncbi:hypothetical protein ACJJTC_004011 [Scirpophaga incertulas]
MPRTKRTIRRRNSSGEDASDGSDSEGHEPAAATYAAAEDPCRNTAHVSPTHSSVNGSEREPRSHYECSRMASTGIPPSTPLTPMHASTSNASMSTSGNFAKCTARFDGKARETEVVEAFIDAVEVYKECTDVSDEHALRGLAMLLEGDAAVWWRGARPSINAWSEALARMRAMYGARQPAYKVWRNIFVSEQIRR